MGSDTSERRTRNAIVREWEAAGRVACPVCGRPIGQGDRFRVSQLWGAVVHPYCLQARVGRPSEDQLQSGACPFYPACPIPFPAQRADYCVCPLVAVINLIFMAARLGEPAVMVPSAGSPTVANAARRAGLGLYYQGVPPREDLAFDDVRKHGVLGPGVDESIWHEPASWRAPPEYLEVDVDRTIRAGRIVAVTPTSADGVAGPGSPGRSDEGPDTPSATPRD